MAGVARWLRGTSLAALLVLPATGLGALVHFALVEHTLCVEHGSLTHGHGNHDGGAPDDSVNRGSDPPAAHGHDHCFVASFTRVGHVGPSAVSEHAAVVPRAMSHSKWPAAGAPVAILRLAPKSSPPA